MDSHGWGSREVADRVGLGINMVSAIRTGRKAPSLEALTRIAVLFDRPVADFLDLPSPDEWSLRHYRLATGLTQYTVAEHLGVDSSAVSRWEGGRSRPPEGTVSALAALYDVSPDDLQQVIDRSHSGPADQVLALAESVHTLAQIALRAVRREPDSPKRRKALNDIRSRIIDALAILNAAMPQLDGETLARAKHAVDQLARVLGDTADK
jgi:transcriptional regulator with XRE-family HTH domain